MGTDAGLFGKGCWVTYIGTSRTRVAGGIVKSGVGSFGFLHASRDCVHGTSTYVAILQRRCTRLSAPTLSGISLAWNDSIRGCTVLLPSTVLAFPFSDLHRRNAAGGLARKKLAP